MPLHLVGFGQLAHGLNLLAGFFIGDLSIWRRMLPRVMGMSTIPSPQAFVDPAVWIVLRLLAGELLPHS
jgi:hypothetical protein